MADKKKEWRQIENLIPFINKRLSIICTDQKDENKDQERPDFIFKNKKETLGIEVTEYHHINIERPKYNAAKQDAFENKVCEHLCNNEYLRSITKTDKLNIIIYKGIFRNHKDRHGKLHEITIESVENEFEMLLREKIEGEKTKELHFIRKIKIMDTKGSNIIQFCHISRKHPLIWNDLKECIQIKDQKFQEYKKCDRNWLCIYVPFEENRTVFDISYNKKIKQAKKLLKSSPYNCIFLTSTMDIDFNILKISGDMRKLVRYVHDEYGTYPKLKTLYLFKE